MNDAPDEELTPDEQAQFARLARDVAPSDLAEARTVAALRGRGLIRSTRSPAVRRTAAVGAGCAAAMMLFLGGVAYGRTTRPHEPRLASPAAEVQRAGSDYVRAMQRLADSTPSVLPAAFQGIEAGTATLRAAAATLALRDGRDSVANALRARLDAAAIVLANDNVTSSGRPVVWF